MMAAVDARSSVPIRSLRLSRGVAERHWPSKANARKYRRRILNGNFRTDFIFKKVVSIFGIIFGRGEAKRRI
jgi:hypothetical protein